MFDRDNSRAACLVQHLVDIFTEHKDQRVAVLWSIGSDLAYARRQVATDAERAVRRAQEALADLARGGRLSSSSYLHDSGRELDAAVARVHQAEARLETFIHCCASEEAALWAEYSAGQAVDSIRVGEETRYKIEARLQRDLARQFRMARDAERRAQRSRRGR